MRAGTPPRRPQSPRQQTPQGAAEKADLNPLRAREDEVHFNAVIKDNERKSELNTLWLCALHGGEDLANQRLSEEGYRTFLRRSGVATVENLGSMMQPFELFASVGENSSVDFAGFVKSLFHLGMLHAGVSEYDVALRRIMDMQLRPWMQEYRAANTHDGTGPEDALLSLPDVDRLLFVYDAVFERIFNSFRDCDAHEGRSLTLDQLQLLRRFVEIDEMRECMRAFGYFPKILSFADISRAAQWSCFGEVVWDPTRQTTGRYSSLDEARVMGTTSAEAALLDAPSGPVTNPLLVSALADANEVLLDKPRFMVCLLRIAQAIYSRPENGSDRLPSIVSRVEAMLAHMAPTYETLFNRPMAHDCDYSRIGVPVLTNATNTAALTPSEGPLEGGTLLTISGSSFCMKRGAFVKFSDDTECFVVRCQTVGKRRVTVLTPSMAPRGTEVLVKFYHDVYELTVHDVRGITVEVSNNRWEYSQTEPNQRFMFRRARPPYAVEADACSRLISQFSAVCSETDRSNTMSMRRTEWRRFRTLYSLGESSDRDSVFFEFAEFDLRSQELALNFRNFLRAVCLLLLQKHGADWPSALVELSNAVVTTRRRAVEARVLTVPSDAVVARATWDRADRRRCIELDVYLGPVYCGSLIGEGGDVVSCVAKRIVHRAAHPWLTYTHVDAASEGIAMGCITASVSLQQLLRRLAREGFDVAARHSKPSTRRPPGRCWRVRMGADSDVWAALWDYPGVFSCVAWQPPEYEMCSPHATMCVYRDEPDEDVIAGLICYTKAKDVGHLRDMLTRRGYVLETKLYKLP